MAGAVHIITTGGTIASRIDPVTGGAVPAVSAAELVELSPAICDHASDVRVTDFGMLQSWNIGPDVMRRLALPAETVRVCGSGANAAHRPPGDQLIHSTS